MLDLRFIFTYLLLVILGGCLLAGCNVVNPHEQVPTYVHVDSFAFVSNPRNSSLPVSHNINTVWAYYNNAPIGTFDLPANIPVMATGDGRLTVVPGIPLSGYNNFLAAYPFYHADTLDFAAQPGKVISFLPKTGYYTTVKNGQLTYPNSTGDFKTSQGVGMNFDSGVCKIKLTRPTDTLSEVYSPAFTIKLNADIFLEFDYKCSVPFYVGFQANLNGSSYVEKIYLVGVNTSDHWQKFYLSAKSFASQYKGDTYNVYFKSSLPSEQSAGNVYLKQVQLLYFE